MTIPNKRPLTQLKNSSHNYSGSSSSSFPEPSVGASMGCPSSSNGAKPLPCLYSNNSIGTSQTIESNTATPEKVLSLSIVLSPYHKRQAHTLYSNVERLINVESPGISHCAFLTLTFPEKVFDHKEVQRRWNSLRTNYFAKHPEFGHYIGVKEQHRDGAWHLHIVIALKSNVLRGFDFKVYKDWLEGYKKTRKRRRLNTGNDYLRSLWSDLRENLEKYKFGRSELIPIRSNSEAVGRYVGKYVSKHMSQRDPQSKGCRLIFSSMGWLKNSINIAWLNDNSKEWRRKLSLFAQYHGCTEMYQLADKLGPTWAYKYQDDIYDIERIIIESMGRCAPDHQDSTVKRIIRNKSTNDSIREKKLNLIRRKSDRQKAVDYHKMKAQEAIGNPWGEYKNVSIEGIPF